MKILKLLIIGVIGISLGCQTDSVEKKYEDSVLGVSKNELSDFEQLNDFYSQKAIVDLPYFEREFEKKNRREFYIITRIYEGEKFEQIYVKVDSIENGKFSGVIDSDPTGLISFAPDERIDRIRSEIIDWLIVRSDGEEEGNLTGKAIDAFQVGVVTFIVEMKPIDGIFEEFNVVSVRNPQTNQEIYELANEEILLRVKEYIMSKNRGKASEDEKPKYTYALVKFPDWTIIE